LKPNRINEISLFEHRFWLQILGDHSRFILNALSPKETHFIHEATQFINVFDDLLEKARRQLSTENLHELNYKTYSAAMKIREFKLDILSRQIGKQIKINLSPTFVNLMVNEVEQYLCILNDLIKGEMPSFRDTNLHLFWLEDGIGHAEAVANALDSTQEELIKKSREYSKIFSDLYFKTIKYKGYLRTGICDFNALRKFNIDVDNIMSCFKKFLKELECNLLEKEVIGTIFPLMAEHMYREECYYLTKLSWVSDTKTPECDPTKPRIET
jgi:hypothetical protein